MKRLSSIYFGILGVIALAFGIADLLVTIGGSGLSFGILEIPCDAFRGGWGGLIILSAGLFYLAGIKNISEIHQISKVMMGSILIWIIAGLDIFAMITESIPGGDRSWFNTLEGFLETYAPPYAPAIFLLPFSLVVFYYILKKERNILKKEKDEE
ncbi:MAG: hypothetical protein MOIL_01111 [Candidatus Methanolliviera sp. GoM_oil]|nr:MAG: hypothetical protein MOIL_01111 [Candidatus Methanolliviera sp. GoM_oil]